MDSEGFFLDRSKCKYFTGLYTDDFGVLFEFLGPAKYNLNYWNSTARKKGKSSKPSSNKLFTGKNQLFVTSVLLRCGFNIYTLSHNSVSEFYIRKIFTTWIMFSYHRFKYFKDLMLSDRHAFQH